MTFYIFSFSESTGDDTAVNLLPQLGSWKVNVLPVKLFLDELVLTPSLVRAFATYSPGH
jgi:hypothetical protein